MLVIGGLVMGCQDTVMAASLSQPDICRLLQKIKRLPELRSRESGSALAIQNKEKKEQGNGLSLNRDS
eukprot:508039-Pelagomonas_calceolata.AAC.3